MKETLSFNLRFHLKTFKFQTIPKLDILINKQKEESIL